ncbi:MAG: DUF4837 family protein [Bacteroidota bacterium]
MKSVGRVLSFSIVSLLIIFLCESCGNAPKVGNPTEFSLESSGKVTVVDATDHSELESPVLNLFVNTIWGIDSQMVNYENPNGGFEPMMIYDVMEASEFFAESSAGNIKNHLSPLICIFCDGESVDDCNAAIVKDIKPLKASPIEFTTNSMTMLGYKYKDVWAQNQCVLIIPIGKKQSLNNFNANHLKIEQWFVDEEYRLGTNSIEGNSKHQDSIANILLENYGLGIDFNYTFKLVLNQAQRHGRILWLRNETPQNHSNIIIQLIDTAMNLNNLNNRSLIAERNQFTKQILRNTEGGWVEVTESGSFPFDIKKIDNHIIEVHGWYSELNTTRRGPFIRKYLVDKELNRTIILDAFVFAPNQSRLPMMRELHRYLKSTESVWK